MKGEPALYRHLIENYKSFHATQFMEKMGWKQHKEIPEGWLIKISKKCWQKKYQKVYFFLSETGKRIKGCRKALQYCLKNNVPKEKVKDFKEFFEITLSKGDPLREKIHSMNMKKRKSSEFESKKPSIFRSKDSLPRGWSSNGRKTFGDGLVVITDENVKLSSFKEIIRHMKEKSFPDEDIMRIKENLTIIPYRQQQGLAPGWTCATMTHERGFKKHVFMTQDGEIVQGKRNAIKYMRDNDYDQRFIDYLVGTFITEDGWTRDDSLRKGWMMRKDINHKKYFLSPDFKFFKSRIHMLEFLKKNDSDHQEPEWRSDPCLPSGWLISDNDGKVQISNISGTIFQSRKEAIDHMIHTQQAPVDIFKLWNTLHLEGWVSDDENLPSGWRKKYHSPDQGYHYLSPMMEVVVVESDLKKHVSADNNCSEEDIKKVEKWIQRISA